ncbi:MAG: hypothetical protein AAF557_19080 [Pseudomonadota bacterium]
MHYSKYALMALPLLALPSCLTAFGNFPGKTCDARPTINLFKLNYENRRKWKAQETPPVILPKLSEVRDVSEVPGTENNRIIQCQGTVVLADGTTVGVYYGWARNYKPNWVSGPRFGWCVETEDGYPPKPRPN